MKRQRMGSSGTVEEDLSIYFMPSPSGLSPSNISSSSHSQEACTKGHHAHPIYLAIVSCGTKRVELLCSDQRHGHLSAGGHPRGQPEIKETKIMGEPGTDKQPNGTNFPHQFNCDVLTGDGPETGKPIGDKCNPAAPSSSSTSTTNRFPGTNSAQQNMISGRFVTVGEAASDSTELARLIDSKLFEVDSPDGYLDNDGNETQRNISPKSDGIPTEPITPMTRPSSKAIHRATAMDMPDIAQNSVEDQLVKSSQLMETILSTHHIFVYPPH